MITKDDTISRAQSGDEGAFVDLMRAHYAFVYAVVIGIVNNPQDAEEIVQDTFLNAYRGLPDLEDTKKFKNWLAKIARNRALNRLREGRIDTVSINEVGEQALPPSDAPDEKLILREQRELIRRAIETLSPKEREVARSYYLEGSSYDELTRTHGLSYKAISVRLSRAKQKLAKRLGHLLTGVFVSPITALKQIYSGGLTVMKVGTVPKITVGAVAIIVLAFIGTRQFISSKEDSSPSVEVVTSTESANSVAPTDVASKNVVTTPLPEDKPQISAEEMQQIEDFFKQIYSGGLTVMKVGTVPKITVGAVAIIVLAFIGTRQFISPNEDSSPSVEVVTSTESANSVAPTDVASKNVVTTPLPEDKPQISAEEMQQIEDFFAQLGEADAQSAVDTPQSLPDTEVAQNTDEHVTTDTDALTEDIEQTAEDVMNAFVEAFRNLDFEVMGSLMTGEGFGNTWLNAQKKDKEDLVQVHLEIGEEVFDHESVPVAKEMMTEEMIEEIRRQMEEQMLGPMLEMINQVEVASSEHVGDEFHFRLGMQAPEIPEILGVTPPDTITGPSDIQIKMRKVDGGWRIYEME